MPKYDVVIIGGGPAGLTAAIYCIRRELKTVIIAKAIGGQVTISSEIQNWPGEKSIGGFELAQKMHEQVKALNAEFINGEVTAVEKTADGFDVVTSAGNYQTNAVILAFGLTPRNLNVPGEIELTGRGVSYCATCDGPLFRQKDVAIIGAGNSAMEAAEYLSKLAKRVVLINKSEKFVGDDEMLTQIKELPNVEIMVNELIREIKGQDKVESIVIAGKDDGLEKTLPIDGVFVEIGFTPKTGWLKGTVDLNERGEVITDKSGRTSVEGIFAAGDCTDVGFKQIVIAAGEGSKAALSSYKFVTAKKGGVPKHDWGVSKK